MMCIKLRDRAIITWYKFNKLMRKKEPRKEFFMPGCIIAIIAEYASVYLSCAVSSYTYVPYDNRREFSAAFYYHNRCNPYTAIPRHMQSPTLSPTSFREKPPHGYIQTSNGLWTPPHASIVIYVRANA